MLLLKNDSNISGFWKTEFLQIADKFSVPITVPAVEEKKEQKFLFRALWTHIPMG